MKKTVSLLAVILLVLSAVWVTAVVGNRKTAELEAKYVSEAEADRAELESLRSELEAATEDRHSDREILTELFRKVDYKDEPVYVIGHKSPDFDTTASAVGMAYLLNALDIEAEARLAGTVNLETEYGLSVIGYPAPELLEDAAGKQLWLVDHSDSGQMVNGADRARIVGITDHHGIGDAETSEPVNVLSCPTGSTSALTFWLCTKCGVEVPQDVAGVLLAGMLSDTSNMKGKDVTALDRFAFPRLREISGISDTDALFNGMLEAKLSYRGMDEREIFYSDYKEYETNGVRYGIGVVKVAHPEQVSAMAERMLPVVESEAENGSDMDLLLVEVYDSDYSLGYMGFCGSDREFAEKVMDAAFGGTEEKRDGFYVSSPSLSRKTDVIPPLDNALNALTP